MAKKRITKSQQNQAERFIKKNVKNPTVAVVLVIAVAVGAWLVNDTDLFNKNQSTPVSFSEQQQHIRCIDGDTFAYGETTIRMLAIDTPETVKPNTPVQPYGKEASNRTCSLLENAKSITFKQDVGNENDKYGRQLAWVYVDDVLLQEILVSEGLAIIKYVNKSTVDTHNLKLLETAESNAKAEKINIWSE